MIEIQIPAQPTNTQQPNTAPPAPPAGAPTPAPSSTANQPSGGPGERPSWLPEKFKSPEDLAKAYAEAEKKLGGKPLESTQIPEPLNFESYTKEFTEKGELSPESFKALADRGIPADLVNQYMAGVQALAKQQVAEVTAAVGGQEAYGQMVQWAANNLPKEQIEAFNKAVSSGDAGSRDLAIQGLHAQYAKTAGPALTQGRGTAGSAVQPYENWIAVQKDMATIQYRDSEEFRNQVRERIRVSKNL
jgi:hypothetical protein